MNKKQEAVDDRDMVFESAVLKYLKQKGYKSAEEAFKHEAKVHSSEHMAIHHTLDVDTSVTNQVLFYNSEENDPNRYKESYSKLRDWVESSLDQYKVSPGQPEPLVEEDETVTTITGKDPADTSAINGKEGKWGVLPVQEALERKAKENAEGEDD
ncbi:hypothetical protein CYMTET_33611, partial [Cymbomonas tetramitiformis]